MPDLLLVTVASDSRRVDLALPVAWPLAEALPELARRVGLLEPGSVPAGLRVLGPDGRVLDPGLSLARQGVRDGALLVMVPGDPDVAVTRHDDPAQATGQAVAERLPSWRPGLGRRVGTCGAGILLALAAAAFALTPREPAAEAGAALAAAVVSLALVGGASVLSRSRDTPAAAAVVLAWAGVTHGGVAGALLAPGWWPQTPHAPVGCAAGGAGAAALLSLAGLRAGRAAVAPAVLPAALATGGASLAAATGVDARVVAASLLVAATASAGTFPRVALATATAIRGTATTDTQAGWGLGPTAREPPDPAAGELDLAVLRADVLLAHRGVVALEASLGLLLAVAAPLTATTGAAGSALAACCCAVALLRVRRFRGAAPVWVGLAAGSAASAATIGVALAQHPGSRAALAGVLLALALVLCALPAHPGPRWLRAADLAESGCLAALIPLLVVATGVLERAHQLGSSLAAGAW